MATWVFNFSKPPKKNKIGLKNLLGGKGANLSEMIKIGLPVPPGFTITTEACNEFYKRNRKNPIGLDKQVKSAIKEVEKKVDRNTMFIDKVKNEIKKIEDMEKKEAEKSKK